MCMSLTLGVACMSLTLGVACMSLTSGVACMQMCIVFDHIPLVFYN